MSYYEDQTRSCADCEQDFTWTASEQAFFHEHGLSDPPRRCQACRQARKAARDANEEHRDDNGSR